MKINSKFNAVKKALANTKSLVFWDIETSPCKFWGWSTGKQYVTHDQICEESKIISIQWMVEGDRKVNYVKWDKNHNDTTMLSIFSELMSNIKVAVSQNGRSFDHKVLRWRLNLLGLQPLRDVEIIDILTLSRTSFKAPSHKLDYRSKAYGLKGKIPMRLQDWIDVMNDKPGALNKMITYGCKDVTDLRNIFWKELPYYKNIPPYLTQLLHPDDKKSRTYCPICASKRQRKFDVYPTKVGNKDMMQCNNCKHLWKETRLVVK